jgi:DNA-binding transcriptional MerR regulator
MTIAEVSKKYDLTQDTLRYYERIGLVPGITRTKRGLRSYSEDDCQWIEFIKCMRGAGLPIEVLIEYVNLFYQGESTIDSRKELLIEQRSILHHKLNEITMTIERVDTKING